MHERPLYYVFALFVALLMVNLVSPVFGDGDVNIETAVTFDVSANKTFFDVSNPVSVNFTADIHATSPSVPQSLSWTVFDRYNNPYAISGDIAWPEKNFTCIIRDPGLYGVRCVAYNGTGSTWHSYQSSPRPFGYITAYLPVSANFTNSTTTGVLPLNVTFYSDNFTNGPTDWEWQFNKEWANTTGNPGYGIFPTAGTYQVNHTLWNRTYDIEETSGSPYLFKNGWVNNSTSRAITIVAKQGVITNFSTNISSFTGQAKGQVPLCLQFFNNSTGDDINGVNWSFGDNTPNVLLNHPIHTYNLPGFYNVTLNVTSPWMHNETTRYYYVNAYMPISANFSSAPAIGANCNRPVFPVQYEFKTNATLPGYSQPDVYNWSFDDGSINDTRRDAIHTFNFPGFYNITLTTLNVTHNITQSEKKRTQISGLYANFTADPMRGFQNTTNQEVRVNFTYNLTDVYDATYYHWDFDNGGSTTAPDITVSTVYNRPGNYTVNFTVGNTCGERNSTEKVIQIIERPVPNFTYQPSYGVFPLKVQFNDTSTDSPDSWEWNFGDGPLNSTSKDPVHIYQSPGTYPIILKVRNSTIVPIWSPEPLLRYITLSSGINANFSANRTIGASPLTVQFKDTSLPEGLVSDREWDFDDNTDKSNLTNPVHTFIGPGNFTVNLTVWNATTKARGNHEKEIQVLDPLVANFKPNDTYPMNKSEGVQFKDLSTGNISTWYWNFGDANHSSLKDPVNFFPDYKEYPVNLTIKNQYGDSNWTEYLVNITPADWPYIDFEVRPPVADDTSVIVEFFITELKGPGIKKIEWDFGDRTEKVQEYNPKHKYEKPGIYTVTVVVTNDFGSVSKTHEASIRGLNPDFTIIPSGGWAVVDTPVSFVDNSDGNPVRWRWDFGDNEIQGTNDPYIVHTYTKEGTYYVNMTAWNWEVPPREVTAGPKKIVIVNKSVPQGVDFEVPELQYSGKHPFDVQFEDKTPLQSNVTDWYWEFGDGSNSFDPAPVHRYENPGQYTVTLTVRNENGTKSARRFAYVFVV